MKVLRTREYVDTAQNRIRRKVTKRDKERLTSEDDAAGCPRLGSLDQDQLVI
jgi:hypothetical protein